MTLTEILARCTRQGDCLLWTGAVSGNGYGRIRHDGTVQPTHRVVYTLQVGPIPDGMTIDHVRDRGCTSRLCQNVDHMEPVSRRVNSQRGRAHQLDQAGLIDRCAHGHPRTPENVGTRADGRRFCRECKRIENRKAYDAMRT